MTDAPEPHADKLTPKAVYKAYRDDQRSGPLSRPLFVARLLAITVACLGAIPTGYNLFMSWRHGIPFGQVDHRLAQVRLWEKNFDCAKDIQYHTVNTGQGTKVDVGACPKSGDIDLRLTTKSGEPVHEWIALADLANRSQGASLLDLFLGHAHAETNGRAPVQMAQAAGAAGDYKVQCEATAGNGKIKRIIREGEKCFEVQISMYSGRSDSRREVPCSTACTPGK